MRWGGRWWTVHLSPPAVLKICSDKTGVRGPEYVKSTTNTFEILASSRHTKTCLMGAEIWGMKASLFKPWWRRRRDRLLEVGNSAGRFHPSRWRHQTVDAARFSYCCHYAVLLSVNVDCWQKWTRLDNQTTCNRLAATRLDLFVGWI